MVFNSRHTPGSRPHVLISFILLQSVSSLSAPNRVRAVPLAVHAPLSEAHVAPCLPDDAHPLPARSASPAGSGDAAYRQLAEDVSASGARSATVSISADALRLASPRVVPYTDVMMEWDRRGGLTVEGDDALPGPAAEELGARPHKAAGAAETPGYAFRGNARWRLVRDRAHQQNLGSEQMIGI